MTSLEHQDALRELALQALALSHQHIAAAERQAHISHDLAAAEHYADLCDALERVADHLYADEQDAAVLLQDAQ